MSTATVLVVCHPTSVDEMRAWATEVEAVAASSAGFVGLHLAQEGASAVVLRFDGADRLTSFLDSPEWTRLVEAGAAHGVLRRFGDVVIVDGGAPPSGVEVFVHDVATPSRDEFLAAQRHLTTLGADASGHEFSLVYGPDALPGGTEAWLSVVKFRTDAQLATWLSSADRGSALSMVRPHLTRDFSTSADIDRFGSIVRVRDGESEVTPNWKSAMMVLLVLYPTVMLLSRFLGPHLDAVGIDPWLSMWLSQIVSVGAMTWFLMPWATRGFAWWLDPERGAGRRVSVLGALVVAGVYAVTLALFASVQWLQFWDYV